MELERLKQIIDAYGGNPQRWPLAERQTAQALLDISPTARQWQQEALQLDTLLDHIAEALPPARLKNHILASIASQEMDIWQWFAQWLWGSTLIQHLWRPALVLGVPIFLGISLGYSLAYQQLQLNESIEIAQNEFATLLYPDSQNLTGWTE